MTKADIYIKTRKLVLNYTSYCDLESNLKKDRFLDSLEVLSLFAEIEKEFNIPINFYEMEKVETVRDLVNLINEKI